MTKKYITVARKMRCYEEDKYAAWRANLEASLMTFLKKNLLIVILPTSSNARTHAMGDDEKVLSDEIDGGSLLAAIGPGKAFVFLLN